MLVDHYGDPKLYITIITLGSQVFFFCNTFTMIKMFGIQLVAFVFCFFLFATTFIIMMIIINIKSKIIEPDSYDQTFWIASSLFFRYL